MMRVKSRSISLRARAECRCRPEVRGNSGELEEFERLREVRRAGGLEKELLNGLLTATSSRNWKNRSAERLEMAGLPLASHFCIFGADALLLVRD